MGKNMFDVTWVSDSQFDPDYQVVCFGLTEDGTVVPLVPGNRLGTELIRCDELYDEPEDVSRLYQMKPTWNQDTDEEG